MEAQDLACDGQAKSGSPGMAGLVTPHPGLEEIRKRVWKMAWIADFNHPSPHFDAYPTIIRANSFECVVEDFLERTVEISGVDIKHLIFRDINVYQVTSWEAVDR